MSRRQLTHIKTNCPSQVLNFLVTSKTLPNKDIIATIKDALKNKQNKQSLTQFALKQALHSKPSKYKLSKD